MWVLLMFLFILGRSRRGWSPRKTWNISSKMLRLGLMGTFIAPFNYICGIFFTRMYRRLWPALALRYVHPDLWRPVSLECLCSKQTSLILSLNHFVSFMPASDLQFHFYLPHVQPKSFVLPHVPFETIQCFS